MKQIMKALKHDSPCVAYIRQINAWNKFRKIECWDFVQFKNQTAHKPSFLLNL